MLFRKEGLSAYFNYVIPFGFAFNFSLTNVVIHEAISCIVVSKRDMGTLENGSGHGYRGQRKWTIQVMYSGQYK